MASQMVCPRGKWSWALKAPSGDEIHGKDTFTVTMPSRVVSFGDPDRCFRQKAPAQSSVHNVAGDLENASTDAQKAAILLHYTYWPSMLHAILNEVQARTQRKRKQELTIMRGLRRKWARREANPAPHSMYTPAVLVMADGCVFNGFFPPSNPYMLDFRFAGAASLMPQPSQSQPPQPEVKDEDDWEQYDAMMDSAMDGDEDDTMGDDDMVGDVVLHVEDDDATQPHTATGPGTPPSDDGASVPSSVWAASSAAGTPPTTAASSSAAASSSTSVAPPLSSTSVAAASSSAAPSFTQALANLMSSQSLQDEFCLE